MKKAFTVTGMHCTSCESLIRDSLEEAGITVHEINHKTGKLVAEFDDTKIRRAKIEQIVQKEGYQIKA